MQNLGSRLSSNTVVIMSEELWGCADQLKALLKHNELQLKNMFASSDSQILPSDLWKIAVSFWSEDVRIIDLMMQEKWNAGVTLGHELYAWIGIRVDLFTNHEEFQPVCIMLDVEICSSRDEYSTTYFWQYKDAFSCVLILPMIDWRGCEYAIKYPIYVMDGIVELRSKLYARLDKM